MASTLTGVWPWTRYALGERLSVWGVAGYGDGSLTLEPRAEDGTHAGAIRTDLDLWMAAVGLRGVALDGGDDGVSLAVKTDAMTVHTASDAVSGAGGNLAAAEAEVTRLRLGLEGSRPLPLADGSTLTPSMEIGLRRDGGDAETGFGAEIGAGIAWPTRARAGRGAARPRSARPRGEGLPGARAFGLLRLGPGDGRPGAAAQPDPDGGRPRRTGYRCACSRRQLGGLAGERQATACGTGGWRRASVTASGPSATASPRRRRSPSACPDAGQRLQPRMAAATRRRARRTGDTLELALRSAWRRETAVPAERAAGARRRPPPDIPVLVRYPLTRGQIPQQRRSIPGTRPV